VVTERARLVRIVEDDKPPGSVRRRGVSYKVEFGVDPPRRPEVIADLLPQGFDYGADFGISSYSFRNKFGEHAGKLRASVYGKLVLDRVGRKFSRHEKNYGFPK